MPAIIRYDVTQTRTVKVWANSAEDAARVATNAFDNGQNFRNGLLKESNVPGNTTQAIEVVELRVVKED